MEKVKVLAIEGEYSNTEKIKTVIEDLQYELVDLVDNAKDALTAFNAHSADIALIDVSPKGNMDGITLAQELQKKKELTLIFTADSHDEKSFDRAKSLFPMGFILKPFSNKELRMVIELAQMNQAQKATQSLPKSTVKGDSFFVKVGHKLLKVLFADIIWIEVSKDYSTLVLGKRRLNVKISLKELEPRLPETFVRCHRNYLINVNAIDSIDTQEGHLTIFEEQLPIGRTYKERVLGMLNLL